MRPDFNSLKSAERWFEKQEPHVRSVLCSRAACRVIPAMAHHGSGTFQIIALATFRSALTSALRGRSDLQTTPISALFAEKSTKFIDLAGMLCAADLQLGLSAMMSKGLPSDLETEDYARFSSNNAGSAAKFSTTAKDSAADAAQAMLFSLRSEKALGSSARPFFDAATQDAESALANGDGIPLWQTDTLPANISNQSRRFMRAIENSPDWAFWHSWYKSMWEGAEIDWDFATEVAKIPDDVWEKGAEEVGAAIERLRNARGSSESDENAPTKPATLSEIQAVKKAASENREALVLSIASVLEQLKEFRERVRGLNHLDGDFREELLAFIDQLTIKLETLLREIPAEGTEIDQAQASRLASWLQEFRPLVRKKAAGYVSPANVAEATVPTSIILGCMAVGTLVGGPIGAPAGAVIGGLLTGHVKPGKAAEELTKPEQSGE